MLCLSHSLGRILIFLWFCEFCIKLCHQDVIETILGWKNLQFDYETDAARIKDLSKGTYKWHSAIPMDVDVFYARNNIRYVFVTIPRLKPGIPVTLGYVTDKKLSGDPVIAPFPNWDWHRNTSQCKNKLVSVFSIKIDKCGYLHVLDSGNEGNGVICPPKIVTFNLNHYPWTVNIKFYYEFPSTLYESYSLFTNLQIIADLIICQSDVNAIAADTADSSIVRVWINPLNLYAPQKYTISIMQPRNDCTKFSILNSNFTLRVGIFAATLTEPAHVLDMNPTYAFIPLSSRYVGHIEVRELLTKKTHYNYMMISTQLHSQTAVLALNRQDIFFMANMQDTSIACAPAPAPEFNKHIHTVYRNTTTMQFASGMKIVKADKGVEQLWILTNRFQKAVTKSYNFAEVNFRISMGWVDEILKDTPCLAYINKYFRNRKRIQTN